MKFYYDNLMNGGEIIAVFHQSFNKLQFTSQTTVSLIPCDQSW